MAEQVLAMMGDMGPGLVDCRDAALLALGVAMAGRRSELACLDWMTRGTGEGVLEVTEHGAIVRLFNSKTSQGQEAEVHIQPGPALRAVRDWVARAGIADGSPLLRAVTRHRVSPERLNDRTIARVVKRRCEAAGLDPEHFSGHSLRSGMITTAAERGVPEWKIAMTSRHSPKGTELKGYIRPVERRKHALTNLIGL
jgi:integrase